jgi:hypothetical protein
VGGVIPTGNPGGSSDALPGGELSLGKSAEDDDALPAVSSLSGDPDGTLRQRWWRSPGGEHLPLEIWGDCGEFPGGADAVARGWSAFFLCFCNFLCKSFLHIFVPDFLIQFFVFIFLKSLLRWYFNTFLFRHFKNIFLIFLLSKYSSKLFVYVRWKV